MKRLKQPTDKLNTNIFGMLFSVLLFGFVTVAATIAFTSHDFWWFSREFTQRPSSIIVYQDGTKTEYKPGDSGFIELAEGVRATLAEGVDRPSGIGLSAASLEDAYDLYLTVEAFFPQPVKLHAWFNTDNPTQMLFPITGRHSDLQVIFLGVNKIYLASGPILKNMQPLKKALREVGYTLD
jgi:hypothetical protein